MGCSALLLQSTITTIAEFKQLQMVTEHKYTVNVTGIIHAHILTQAPFQLKGLTVCFSVLPIKHVHGQNAEVWFTPLDYLVFANAVNHKTISIVETVFETVMYKT